MCLEISSVRTTDGKIENSLYLLAHEKDKYVAQTLEIHEMFTGTECRCYVPASIVFWGQKTGCWDNPKPFKVSGIVLTSAVVSQRRCLILLINRLIESSDVFA